MRMMIVFQIKIIKAKRKVKIRKIKSKESKKSKNLPTISL
jgi:hypothetical protein